MSKAGDKHWDWQPIETAPKDGSRILISLPGGHWDDFYVVRWEEGNWMPTGEGKAITEQRILRCYTRPSWVKLDDPPGSLCRNDEPAPSPEEMAWNKRARGLWS
jgi:hypothetical protein